MMGLTENILVRCSGISKTYPGKPPVSALREISMEVSKGEIFGLIGPDGAGKTTLFRMLATLALPDTGHIDISGWDTRKDFRVLRNIIGYMPGRFSLYQDLSVKENLEFFAGVFNTTVEKNYDLIRDIYVQIEPFSSRKAGKLSGGMKQKLALCCALIHQPELLILDEPTTGVDPVSRKEFWEMLRKLKEQGITIVVSTPYMDEAVLCGRIALIQSGSIMGIDTPDNIIQAYKRTLYAMQSGDNYGLLGELRRRPEVNSCYIFGESLHVTFADVDNGGLLEELGQENVRIWEIRPTIEDCFIDLME
ncbi:MAG: ABC transporter ATP-binding protein [Bacteroidales bacterium]|jgi:ABC-type multidrug transport system ATPase subunit|nr:ABC transporter ATP-binding protein [Bacteroidales bacterium]